MSWQPPTPRSVDHPPPVVVPVKTWWTAAVIIAAIASVILMLGAMLPWATITTVFGSASVNGMEGDGRFTLGAGAAACTLLLTGAGTRVRSLLVLGALCGLVGVGVALNTMRNLSEALSLVESDGVEASIGIGLHLSVLSGLAVFIAGMIAQSDAKP